MSLILRDLIHFTRLLNLLFQELNYGRCFNGSLVASEYNTSPPPAISLPNSGHLYAYALSCTLYPVSLAQLRSWLPLGTQAYRFVYPSLLVSGLHQAVIFDVPMGTRVQRIDELQDASHLRPYLFDNIAGHDVDLGAQQVLVYCAPSLNVFSCATGDCTLQIGSNQIMYQQRLRLYLRTRKQRRTRDRS